MGNDVIHICKGKINSAERGRGTVDICLLRGQKDIITESPREENDHTDLNKYKYTAT